MGVKVILAIIEAIIPFFRKIFSRTQAIGAYHGRKIV